MGAGLPTHNNTHEAAQAVAPEARIVYVDNDPLVLAHARALMASTPEGATAYLHADLREPEHVLASAREHLDLDRPVALMLMGVLGHITDEEEARDLVRRLMAALPSGSHLVSTTAPMCTAGPTQRRTNSTTRAAGCSTSSGRPNASADSSRSWIWSSRGW